MKLLKLNMTVALAAGLTAVALAQPASAQKVNSKHLEKANWHNAPRQFQIIDDRPIIKDFREAPQASQQIDLPDGSGHWLQVPAPWSKQDRCKLVMGF